MPDTPDNNMPNTNTIADSNDTNNVDNNNQNTVQQNAQPQQQPAAQPQPAQTPNQQSQPVQNNAVPQNNTAQAPVQPVSNLQSQPAQATNTVSSQPTQNTTPASSTSSVSSVVPEQQAQSPANSQGAVPNTTQTLVDTTETQPQANTQAPAEQKSDKSNLVTIILLLLIYPVGMLVMWVWPKWKVWVKILVTIPFIVGVIGGALLLFGLIGPAAKNSGASDLPGNTNVRGTTPKEICMNSCIDLYPNRGSGYASCISTCDDF